MEIDKFPEPRGWALMWEGSALSGTEAQEVRHGSVGEAQGAAVGWMLHWEQFALPETGGPVSSNGYGKNGFGRPQGWALQWDGFALARAEVRQDAAGRSRVPDFQEEDAG
jgi:hypothetical protein